MQAITAPSLSFSLLLPLLYKPKLWKIFSGVYPPETPLFQNYN